MVDKTNKQRQFDAQARALRSSTPTNKQTAGYYMDNPTARRDYTPKVKIDMPGVSGGLGIKPYNSSAASMAGVNTAVNPKSTTAARNYEYGNVMGKPPVPKPKARPVRKPTEITIPGGGLKSAKVTSASNKSKPMATNRFTGSSLGFTSGKTTGKTVTKSGVAGKSTAASRAAMQAYEKGGVAGPTKNAAGKNASSMTGNRSKNSGRSLSGKP